MKTLSIEEKLQLDHWYDGLPNSLKENLPHWRESSYEKRRWMYSNPTPGFIKADKIFLAEIEKHNHA